MDPSRRSRIYSLAVLGHRPVQDGDSKYIGYILQVQATTRFMHPVFRQSPPTFSLTVRFREFRELHHQLSSLFSGLPAFPGQRLYDGKNPAALDKRAGQLNSYFTALLEFPEAQSSEPVLRLITPRTSFKLGVVGYKGSGKRRLLQYIIGQVCPANPEADVSQELPVDFVVDERLCRVRSVTPVHCDDYMEDGLFMRAMCSSLHGALLLYDEARKDHMERLDSLVTVPSEVIGVNQLSLEVVCEAVQRILRHVR